MMREPRWSWRAAKHRMGTRRGVALLVLLGLGVVLLAVGAGLVWTQGDAGWLPLGLGAFFAWTTGADLGRAEP